MIRFHMVMVIILLRDTMRYTVVDYTKSDSDSYGDSFHCLLSYLLGLRKLSWHVCRQKVRLQEHQEHF